MSQLFSNLETIALAFVLFVLYFQFFSSIKWNCPTSVPPVAPQSVPTPSDLLLDKNGNPLRGAALKARMRKLQSQQVEVSQ